MGIPPLTDAPPWPGRSEGAGVRDLVGWKRNTIGLWRTKSAKKGGRGAWYDAFIAGAAAYVDVLVTNDRDQARRAEFLLVRGLVTFRVDDVEAFIGGTLGVRPL